MRPGDERNAQFLVTTMNQQQTTDTNFRASNVVIRYLGGNTRKSCAARADSRQIVTHSNGHNTRGSNGQYTIKHQLFVLDDALSWTENIFHDWKITDEPVADHIQCWVAGLLARFQNKCVVIMSGKIQPLALQQSIRAQYKSNGKLRPSPPTRAHG